MSNILTGISRFRFTFLVLFLTVFLAMTLSISADEIVVRRGASDEQVVFRSVVELERAILDDREWMSNADRLMNELHTLDVRLYSLINTTGSDESRQKLIRERNNVRRLIVTLTGARNSVYTRLANMRDEYNRINLRSDF